MTGAMPYQLFPALDDADYAALKADIAERGVMVPVEYDEEGNILDGHHRVQAWTELAYEGVALEPYPRVIREGMTEAQKRAHVRKLNILRRHLSQEQKRDLIRDQVKETPERSNRQVAGSLGVDHKTVGAVREELESSGEIPQIDTRLAERNGQTYTVATTNIGRRPNPPIRHVADPEVNQDQDDDEDGICAHCGDRADRDHECGDGTSVPEAVWIDEQAEVTPAQWSALREMREDKPIEVSDPSPPRSAVLRAMEAGAHLLEEPPEELAYYTLSKCRLFLHLDPERIAETCKDPSSDADEWERLGVFVTRVAAAVRARSAQPIRIVR